MCSTTLHVILRKFGLLLGQCYAIEWRVSTDRAAKVVNLINPGDGHPLCIIEQKDNTARLHARGIWEIPFTKVNQVDTSHTGRTVQGRAALSVLTLQYGIWHCSWLLIAILYFPCMDYHWSKYTFTYLLNYFLTYLLTYLLTDLLTYLLTYLFTYLLTCLLTYLLTYLLN